MVAYEGICTGGEVEKGIENGKGQEDNGKIGKKKYKQIKDPIRGKVVAPQPNSFEKSWTLEDRNTETTYAFDLSFNYHIPY